MRNCTAALVVLDLGDAFLFDLINAQDAGNRQVCALHALKLIAQLVLLRIDDHVAATAKDIVFNFDEAIQVALIQPARIDLVDLPAARKEHAINVRVCLFFLRVFVWKLDHSAHYVLSNTVLSNAAVSRHNARLACQNQRRQRMKLTVLHYPDPRLRLTARPVKEVRDATRQIADDMLETMYHERGIGLAATQVGITKRILVMDVSEDKSEPLVLINPCILDKSGVIESNEGCLSVPGFYEPVRRASRIEIEYLDRSGKRVHAEWEGMHAVCAQHEIDHLDGKLFVDYLSSLKRNRIRKRIEKQRREIA